MYAIPGFILGMGIAVLVMWFSNDKILTFQTFTYGLLGSSCLLFIGEKFRRLPSAKGIEIMRIREEMAPIDLKPEHAIPNTLKTEMEKTTKS